MRRGGAKSFVDDLGWSRGVVLSRAATLLRSIETQPCDSKICSHLTNTLFEHDVGIEFIYLLIFLSVEYSGYLFHLDVREFDSHHRQ